MAGAKQTDPQKQLNSAAAATMYSTEIASVAPGASVICGSALNVHWPPPPPPPPKRDLQPTFFKTAADQNKLVSSSSSAAGQQSVSSRAE
jgi:hypothetical protein